MSGCDVVNEQLTAARLFFQAHPDMFSERGREVIEAICGTVRMYLMKEDVSCASNYIDDVLAREPDAASFLLEELFARLGVEDREMFEDILRS